MATEKEPKDRSNVLVEFTDSKNTKREVIYHNITAFTYNDDDDKEKWATTSLQQTDKIWKDYIAPDTSRAKRSKSDEVGINNIMPN